MTVPLRAALYLRVSTPRQAGHDLSIPDPEAAGRSVLPVALASTRRDLCHGRVPNNDRWPEFSV